MLVFYFWYGVHLLSLLSTLQLYMGTKKHILQIFLPPKIITVAMIPYRTKIYKKYNLATWLGKVKFTVVNMSECRNLNFNDISHH